MTGRGGRISAGLLACLLTSLLAPSSSFAAKCNADVSGSDVVYNEDYEAEEDNTGGEEATYEDDEGGDDTGDDNQGGEDMGDDDQGEEDGGNYDDDTGGEDMGDDDQWGENDVTCNKNKGRNDYSDDYSNSNVDGDSDVDSDYPVETLPKSYSGKKYKSEKKRIESAVESCLIKSLMPKFNSKSFQGFFSEENNPERCRKPKPTTRKPTCRPTTCKPTRRPTTYKPTTRIPNYKCKCMCKCKKQCNCNKQQSKKSSPTYSRVAIYMKDDDSN